MSIALISNQISTNLNDEIFHYLIRFLQVTGSALTVESLHSLAHLLLDYRPSEPIRQFWKVFFDILLEKSNSLAVVEFFSEALKRNSNLPYLHLFEVDRCWTRERERMIGVVLSVVHQTRRIESIARHRRSGYSTTRLTEYLA